MQWISGPSMHADIEEGKSACITASEQLLAWIDRGSRGIALPPIPSFDKSHFSLTRHISTGCEISKTISGTSSQLAAVSQSSCLIKIWKMPMSIEDGTREELVATLSDISEVVDCHFHPCAPSLLASCGGKYSHCDIWDTSWPDAAVLTYDDSIDGDARSCSICWSSGCEAIALMNDQGRITVLDPQKHGKALTAMAHSRGPSRAMWDADLSGWGKVLTTGANCMREREACIWDGRNLGKPLQRVRIGGIASKALEPLSSPCGLVVLAGIGDIVLKVFHFHDGPGGPLLPLNPDGLRGDGNAGLSHTILPQRACHHEDAEVLRVYMLTNGGRVESLSGRIIRKDKSVALGFTYMPIPLQNQCLEATDWLKGKNDPPMVGPVVEEKVLQAVVSGGTINATSSESSPSPPTVVLNQETLDIQQRLEYKTKQFRLKDKRRLKNVIGKIYPRETITNLSIDDTAQDSKVLAASALLVAAHWKGAGGGGSVWVAQHEQQKGNKVDPSPPLLRGHKGPVRSLSFSPYNPLLLASGSEDSTVMLWNVPKEGLGAEGMGRKGLLHRLVDNCVGLDWILFWNKTVLTNGLGSPSTVSVVIATLLFHKDALVVLDCNTHPVLHLAFHHTVPQIIFNATADNCVQALDITANAVVSRLENPAAVNSMYFSTSADLGAITGRDGILRVFSPRTGSVVGCSSQGGNVDNRGGPRQQCTWWGRSGMDFIITTGFGALSQQRVYLWDVRNLSTFSSSVIAHTANNFEPVTRANIDYSNGIMYPLISEATGLVMVSGRGDTSIHSFELCSGGSQCNGNSNDNKLSEGGGGGWGLFPTTSSFKLSGGVTSGISLIPQTSYILDIMKCEVARILRLTESTIQLASLQVPRSKHLLQYFQDDLYDPVPVPRHDVEDMLLMAPCHNELKEAWLGGKDVQSTLQSLQPEGVLGISEKPESPKMMSKSAMYQQQMRDEEKEEKQITAEYDRLARLAQQNAVFNPNFSMGDGNTGDNEVDCGSDDGWDD